MLLHSPEFPAEVFPFADLFILNLWLRPSTGVCSGLSLQWDDSSSNPTIPLHLCWSIFIILFEKIEGKGDGISAFSGLASYTIYYHSGWLKAWLFILCWLIVLLRYTLIPDSSDFLNLAENLIAYIKQIIFAEIMKKSIIMTKTNPLWRNHCSEYVSIIYVKQYLTELKR